MKTLTIALISTVANAAVAITITIFALRKAPFVISFVQEQEAQAHVSEQTKPEESELDRLKRLDSLSRELQINSGVLHEPELDKAAHKHLERAMSGQVDWHTAPDNETDEGQAAAIGHEGQSHVGYSRNYLSEFDGNIEHLEKTKYGIPSEIIDFGLAVGADSKYYYVVIIYTFDLEQLRK